MARLRDRPFVIGDRQTIVDLSLCAYLSFPAEKTGYEFALSHTGIHTWLADRRFGRMASAVRPAAGTTDGPYG
jgi:glutathione S-transferase